VYVCVERDTHNERERERERERDDGLLVEGVWRRRSSISMVASVEDEVKYACIMTFSLS